MTPTRDELAGTVDGFGGLTRAELVGALDDLAARTGETLDREALTEAIDAAIDSYYLLEIEPAALESPTAEPGIDQPLLVAGPAALPRLPEGGEDLPHLLDLAPRSIDRAQVARTAEARLRAEAAAVIADGDSARAEPLLDACYEVEAWGPVDLTDAKAGLAELLS